MNSGCNTKPELYPGVNGRGVIVKFSVQKRASLYTVGCRLNQSETQTISERLGQSGYSIVPFGEKADLGIINTCTVTREADAKCRQVIRRFIRKNPEAYTAVIGCYSQMGTKSISEIPGVDLIVGNAEKLSVLDYVEQGKSARPVILRDRIDRENFSIQIAGELPYPKRANLKIQDGCDFMCSFCIIPFARGRARSREFHNTIEEAENLAAREVREIVLTGVNIGTYQDGNRDIVSVVDALNATLGIDRIRLSSIEPTTVPMELIARMGDSHALLPYLHIPLQSGSDATLKRMRRRYGVEEYTEFINDASRLVSDLCIGTDILVGFPGESEADFEETCRMFLKNPFAYCHVFPYSEREGTPASRSTDHVPVPERNRRSAYLRKLSAERRYEYNERFLGRDLEVLFEDRREGSWPGYTGNYIRVVCGSEKDLTNRRAKVRLERISADFVEGRIVTLID